MYADRPSFLITIDTEGDNLWSRPARVTTKNAGYLPRFQALAESYGLKPTYLTNYEMATCPAFIEFGRDVLARGAGEIGMHLHAWNSPPIVPLTSDDWEAQPYLIDYPLPVMREKIVTLTGVLEETFGRKMLCHRAGRWAFNAVYANLLEESGYAVDCSITPYVAWPAARSDGVGQNSADYTVSPEAVYYVDVDDVRRPGLASLMEVPMTIRTRDRTMVDAIRSWPSPRSLWRRALLYWFPSVVWLRPNGRNRNDLQWLLTRVIEGRCPYAEFMLHSSELMPGGSPTFQKGGEIERLYDDLQWLFEVARDRFVAATLGQFADSWQIGSKTSTRLSTSDFAVPNSELRRAPP